MFRRYKREQDRGMQSREYTREYESFIELFAVSAGKMLIYTVLAALILSFSVIPFISIFAIYFGIKALLCFVDVIDYAFFHTTGPLRWIHSKLTHTEYDSPYVTVLQGRRGVKKRVRYYSVGSFIGYGIIGNLVFWIPLIIIVMTILSFRPYGDGYVLKHFEYSIGDEVYVKTLTDGKQMLIITGEDSFRHYEASDQNFYNPSNIIGEYIEDDLSTPNRILHSYYSYAEYWSDVFHYYFIEVGSDD